MTRKLPIVFALLALSAFAISACGGDDETTSAATTEAETTAESTSSGGSAEALAIEADPDGALAYTTGDLEATAGTVEIDFDNPSQTGHDVRVESPDGEDVGGTDVITGEATTASVELEPGTYTYYCSLPGHRDAGMEASITVK